MRHVRMHFHDFGMLAIFCGVRQHEFVVEFTVVSQHEFDLLALPDLKPRRGEQHFSVRLSHRHLNDFGRLPGIGRLTGRE